MKKLAIFSHASGAYGPARFKQEAQKAGISADAINYGDLDFVVTKESIKIYLKGERELPFYDYAIFRSAGGENYYVPQRDYLLNLLAENGCRVLNKETYQLWGRLDKLTQSFVCQQNNLPFVETRLYADRERMQKNITYPSVVKVYFGSQGKKVFRVDKWNDVEKILELYVPCTLLVQPMLPPGEDIRVIVVGGKVIGAMKRTASSGAFLTNFSQGGSVQKYDLDENMIDIAQKAARAFRLEYVGVDLMKDIGGNWLILEVNRACQFEGFEQSTGINVPQLTLEYLLNR